MSCKIRLILLLSLCISGIALSQDSNIYLLPIKDCNLVSDTCVDSFEALDVSKEIFIPERFDGDIRVEDRREDWFFYVVLFQMILVGIVKWFFPKQIEMAVKSFLNLNLAAYQFREERGEGSLFKIILNINFVLSISLMCICIMQFYNYLPPLSFFLFFLVVVFLLSLLFLLKYLQYLILALVLPVEQIAQFFQFVYFAIFRALGIALIPFNLLMYYSSQKIPSYLFIAVVVLFVSFILFRIYRGLSISQSLIIQNKVHFFLYICTLEIMPVLLLVKFLSGFFV